MTCDNKNCGLCRPPDRAKREQLSDDLVYFDTGIFNFRGVTVARVSRCESVLFEKIKQAIIEWSKTQP